MTAEAHPTREDLAQFMLGELPPADNRRVLRHLLRDCPFCHQTTSRMWEVGSEEASDPADCGSLSAEYDSVIDRVFARVRQANVRLETERVQAPQLLEELSRQPLERQRLLVQNSSRFHSWGLCELLLNASQERRFADAREGAGLAGVAVAVAESLDPLVYGPALLQDLKSRAWACLGNAKRILSDLRSAEHFLQVAESHLARGTGDRLEKARLLDLKASLRKQQGRIDEALALLNRAIAIYQRSGQRHLLGRVLLSKGYVHVSVGDNETAIALLRQGLTLIEAKRDERLVLTARHNLALSLYELGHLEEARELVLRIRRRYVDLGDAINLVRLRYLEGGIELASGRLDKAEAIFREVRQAFGEHDIPYEAALASIHLAEVYARQGRHAEVRALGQEMLPIFRSRDMHREAIAALIMFQKAVEAESVTVGLLQDVAGKIQKVRRETGGRNNL